MSSMENANQRLILTHAVLIGLTPLIPLPLLDDLTKTYLQRRLARKLLAAHGEQLSVQEIQALADDPNGGCLSGCLSMILLYPIKKIFRKIFFFLEWKRAIDLVSRAYHHGYLLDYALQQGWRPPTPSAPQLRVAIDDVCREVGTSPIEHAVRATFNQSKEALKNAATLLARSLQGIRKRPAAEEVAAAVEAVEEQEERQIEGVTARLQKNFEKIPAEHFQRLCARLAARLTTADTTKRGNI
ncbi:MAG: hypothetical protein AB1489_10265 [Acidobacteriota bacterium]